MKTPVHLWAALICCLTGSILPLFSQDIVHEIMPLQQIYRGESYQMYLDNDAFSGLRIDEDRNYTMGIAFGYYSSNLNRTRMHGINDAVFKTIWNIAHWGNKRPFSSLEPLSAGILISNMTFTPENLLSTTPVFDDRPYANIISLDSRVSYYDPNRKHIHSFSISYGVLGTPIADYVQTVFHIIGPERPVPEGWHNQISHPIEPTMLINYRRNRFWKYNGWQERKLYLDLQETMSFDLGYRVGASYTLTGRIGRELGRQGEGEGFLFIQGKPYVVGYDALLMGQFRPSPHTKRFDELNHFLFEGSAGLGIRYPVGDKMVSALYGWYFHPPEADYGIHTRNHYWGRFQLAVAF